MSPVAIGRLVLILFLFSGLAGLIYQSIWSQYLGLLLGHAAYAQTLVLAIFMGGMAWGAWLASKWSEQWRRLFRAYAIAEVIIGVFGLGFHAVFVAYSSFSTEVLLPALPGSGLASVAQWLGAALLIAPQSVLLGMTFPLMSSAVLRVVPRQDGEVLGGLYFSNSFGAAIGALVTTFLLVPLVGLPGTVFAAGVLNILVGAVAWFITADQRALVQAAHAPGGGATPPREPFSPLARPLLLATFLSGAASFVYEVSWIRMLNQVLGTSIHSFELMLASFILGLALGGLWVRRYHARISDPVRVAGWAQLLMGSAALLSLLAFSRSFDWVAWLMGALGRNEAGYTLYSLGSATVAIIIMLPAAFFAGMTLPLFTMAVLRTGGGERAIGRIYALNTLGAIVGVFVCMHLLIPAVGVRLSLALAAILDMAIGMVLLRRFVQQPSRWVVAAAGSVAAVSLLVGLHFGKLDPITATSGVFRTGKVTTGENSQLYYYRDGKTATVSVYSRDMPGATISTNGKPDASLSTTLALDPTMDEVTMAMLGALPLVFHPEPRRVAFVGWGSGMSTHTLLGSPVPQQVDTIEIELAMYEGARIFGARVERAYKDPRSRLHIDDARKYFAQLPGTYDAIVSEPSNPWVSGVANLFTKEFYALSRRALTPDGVFVQWLHTYEITDELVATMVAALLEVFPEVKVYTSNHLDIMIVASAVPLELQSLERLEAEPLGSELERVGLGSEQEFNLRYIGDRPVLEAFVRATASVPHSDYYPHVSHEAPRTRFAQQSSYMLQTLVDSGLPVLDLIHGRTLVTETDGLVIRPENRFGLTLQRALWTHRSTQQRRVLQELAEAYPEIANALALLFDFGRHPIPEAGLAAWSRALNTVARATVGHLSSEQLGTLFYTESALGDLSGQHSLVHRSLRSVEAMAQRDAEAMRTRCRASLDVDLEDLAAEFSSTLAACVVLAEIALGNRDAAVQALDLYAQVLAVDPDVQLVARFLRAWVERPQARS